MQYDNAARRLHEVLTEAIQASKDLGAPNSVNTRQVWNTVFGESTDEELLAELDDVHNLVKLSRGSVNRLQKVSNKKKYLNSLDAISALMHQIGFLNAKWLLIWNVLQKPMLLDMLEATADAIDNECNLLLLSDEQQKYFLESAQALLNEVSNSCIDKTLKKFLVARLEEICSAMRHYAMSGSEGLIQVIEANIGGAVVRSITLAGTESDQSLLDKFMSFMLKGSQLLGVVADCNGLLPAATKILKSLPPSS